MRAGCSRAIRCAYHGWTYALDGKLLGAPELRSFPGGIDRPNLGLHGARVEVLCGLVFVNLDPDATPLAELLGDLPQRLERYDIPSMVRAKGGDDHHQNANWKIVADNYLEGYHVPIAHPGLMRLLDYERYGADVHENYVWFEAPMRPEPSENRTERLYQRLVRPMGRANRGRPPRLALPLHLSEHGDRPLSRPGRLSGRSTPTDPSAPAMPSRCCAPARRASATASSAA